jgi:flagellar motility protein MotE (MotC chaperone)
LNEAHNKRTARSIRRQIAAHRVRLCEDNLKSLREDLQHADKDLEEVDNNIGVLEDLYRQKNAAMVNTTSDVGHATSTTFYDSGASDDSASSTSDL